MESEEKKFEKDMLMAKIKLLWIKVGEIAKEDEEYTWSHAVEIAKIRELLIDWAHRRL